MAWSFDPPRLPPRILAIPDEALRRHAEAAWAEGHRLLGAMDAWDAWLKKAKAEYAQTGEFDGATGRSIVDAGRTAIQALMGLGVNCAPFEPLPETVAGALADPEPITLEFLWPAEDPILHDLTAYVAPEGAEEKELEGRWFLFRHTVEEDLRGFLRLLEETPDAAMENRQGANAAPSTPPRKRPPDKAFQAWFIRDILGVTSQKEVAAKLGEHGVKSTQGQVSRWLKDVDEYRKAGGLMPTPNTLGKVHVVDPNVIDMGAHEEGRTPRQRHRRDSD